MMIELTLAPTRDHFLQDDRPFFYLADTAWMTFSNITLDGWSRYLDFRRRQGFNAVQISILPVTHDRSVPAQETPPFLPRADGSWDFARINPAYFDNAEAMVQLMVDKGFLPSLTVLWCSYVPGTRCAAASPIPSVMPLEHVRPFAEYAMRRFKRYAPLLFVSGDTRFESPDEPAYYTAALDGVKAVWPEAKVSMHINWEVEIPPALLERLDYYAYQSGHHDVDLGRPYKLAQQFRAYARKLPILNAEPCYEAHARSRTGQARWAAFDVRRATWQSLLTGAKMGITYGVHGVWSFHQRGQRFLNAKAQEPPDWETALHFDGAWDVGFAKWIFETHGLVELEPADILLNQSPDTRAAMNADGTKVAIYAPYPLDLRVDLDLRGHDCTLIDLATRRILVPRIEGGRPSTIALPPVNADCLFLASKRA